MFKPPTKRHKEMQGRNYTLLLVLVAFVILVAVVTYVKLKANVS